MVTHLLDTLGYADGEYVSLNHQAPGGAFRSEVVAYGPEVESRALVLAEDANVWFGVNPTRPTGKGRGTADDVTRIAAIWCDLDVKPGACRDLAHAHQVIDELAAILGIRPSAVVMSGNGLQPYWPIDGGQIDTAEDRATAAALLKRWGRLACIVADGLGAKIDRGVYDLARVLRVPGSRNLKDADNPKPVTLAADTGAPLGLDELRDRLDEHGVAEYEGDRRTTHEIVSKPDTWTFAPSTCEYFAPTIRAWADEPLAERHPWLVRVAVRLMAAVRHRCLTADEYTAARKMIGDKFIAATGEARAFEVASAFEWAEGHVASKTDAELATEFGSHLHLWQRAEPRRIELTAAPAPATDGALAPVVDITTRRQPVAADVTLTDTGNADLIAAAHGAGLRYCPDAGKWLTWAGSRWRTTTEAAAYEAAREVIESIRVDDDSPRDLIRHRTRSLSRRGIADAVALMQRRAAMCVNLADLDAAPYELNTPDGIVDLKTGTVRPHDPEAWHTKIAGVGYAPDVDAPMWARFLARTFGGDADLIDYVQRLAGLASIGEVLHHILPFLFGGGSNGKSVLMDVLTTAFGDYAIAAPQNFLLAGRDRHETEIARLHGARLVTCSELNPGSKFDEGKVKLLTGGDVLSGRYMRQDLFDFVPSHTLFLMGNHQPAVAGGGTSFWRRLQTVPFNHTVPEAERVEGLAQKLVAAEGAAILAWVVTGARKVLGGGLSAPSAVREATAAYATEEDAVGQFVADCLAIGDGSKTPRGDVTGAYNRWCMVHGERPKSTVELGRELSRHAVTVDGGRRNYLVSVKSGWRRGDMPL